MLSSEIAACTLCADLPRGPRPIVQLSPTAKILIASQAPGSLAHESGIPFQDPSGRRLRHWMGLDEAAFYDPSLVAILPMGFCYPGKAAGGDAPPRALCAATWRAQCLDYLAGIDLILNIGRHSLAWHLPHLKTKPLTTLARSQPKASVETFILPHPSPRNTRWLKDNAWFESDMVPQIRRAVSDRAALL